VRELDRLIFKQTGMIMINQCEFCKEELKYPVEIMMLEIYYISYCNGVDVDILSCCEDNMVKGMRILELYRLWIGNPRN